MTDYGIRTLEVRDGKPLRGEKLPRNWFSVHGNVDGWYAAFENGETGNPWDWVHGETEEAAIHNLKAEENL